MFGAGLRVGEALALYPRDVEGALSECGAAKGSKDRLVGLDPYAAAFLARWIDRRTQPGLNGRHAIFATYEVGKVGQPLSQPYVRAALRRLATKAGIEKRVHSHGLRHSMAFGLAQRHVPMHMLPRQLGHARLATTDRYINHLNPQDVVETMQQRDWSAAD